MNISNFAGGNRGNVMLSPPQSSFTLRLFLLMMSGMIFSFDLQGFQFISTQGDILQARRGITEC